MPWQQSDWSEDQLEPETPLHQRLLGSEPQRGGPPAPGKPQEFPVPRISFGVTEAAELLEQLRGYAEDRNLRLEELLETFLKDNLP